MKQSNKWVFFSALLLLFNFAFGAGTLAASIILKERPQQAVQAAANGNWGLSFQTEGKHPVANATADQLAQSKHKTKTKSKTTFTMLDKIKKYNGVFESPKARKIAATPLYKAINTMP